MRELMTDELDAVTGGDSITCQPSNSPTVTQISCPVGYLEIVCSGYPDNTTPHVTYHIN
jgi:hypothetical protein